MPIVEVRNLSRAVVPGGRAMGIDVGTKTLGLALSDTTWAIASPLVTLRRTRFHRDAGILAGLVGEHDVRAFVIGLPISMDGTEGPKCQSVRQFAANLLGFIDAPAAFWDERWSTVAIERMLVREADLSRKRRSQVVDSSAASYILQGALDYLSKDRAASSS